MSKTLWGSSTRDLEQARVNAIVKTYDEPLDRCYEQALKIAREAEYHIFIENKSDDLFVVMGIPGSVDTTRVGIFFSELSETQTKVYVSSLSSNAKRKVAHKLMPKLDAVFGVEDSQSATTIDDQQQTP